MNCIKIISSNLFKETTPFQHNLTTLRNLYKPRRALLYVPGDDLKKINKSFTLNADCIALDCEDGVAINKKEQARTTIKQFLDQPRPNDHSDVAVRINALNTPYWQDDLKTLCNSKYLFDTILLPKVDTVEIVEAFSDALKTAKSQNPKKINLIALIESPTAFINLVDICRTAERISQDIGHFKLTSLVFGSDDFCASLGVTRTENSEEILYARQKLVLVAKAFKLQPIDMVYIKYKDLEGLKRHSYQSMQMGYTGRQVIHPSQVAVAHGEYLPTKEQIDWAAALLAEFEKYQNEGKGAFNYQNHMIDMPTVKQAQNIIQLSRLK